MTKKGSTNFVNFITPGAGLGRGLSHILKLHYLFKILLLFFHAQIRQTKYIVMNTIKGSTKIVNFVNPGTGVLV